MVSPVMTSQIRFEVLEAQEKHRWIFTSSNHTGESIYSISEITDREREPRFKKNIIEGGGWGEGTVVGLRFL